VKTAVRQRKSESEELLLVSPTGVGMQLGVWDAIGALHRPASPALHLPPGRARARKGGVHGTRWCWAADGTAPPEGPSIRARGSVRSIMSCEATKVCGSVSVAACAVLGRCSGTSGSFRIFSMFGEDLLECSVKTFSEVPWRPSEMFGEDRLRLKLEESWERFFRGSAEQCA